MADNLKEKMVTALKWSTVDRFGQQAVQFAISIVLSRLLSPDDFGLMGLVMIFAALSYVIVDSGFGQALIRKKDASDLDYSTVFFFNLSISILLYLLLFFVSPYIASFFNQPTLKSIARVIFIAIIFNSLYLVQFAQLSKKMDYKTLAKINVLSVLLSGLIGVGMAFTNFGVWALVFQQVLFHFFRFVFSVVLTKWRPQLLFSFSVITNLWRFSINLLGTSILNILFNSIYLLILGRFYPKSEVGYYTQGNKLTETFNFTFQSIFIGSSYSLFSQIQHDDERFLRVFREISQKIALITLPILLLMIAIAEPLIEVVWSAKFLPSVDYFRFLCLAALFAPLYALNITALNAKGNSKSTFRIELIKKSLILISVFVAFPYGIFPMLWGYVAASMIAYLFSVVVINKNLKHCFSHQLQDVIYSLMIAVVIAVGVFYLKYINLSAVLLLIIQLSIAGLLYALVLRLFYRKVYDKILSIITIGIRKVIKLFSL